MVTLDKISRCIALFMFNLKMHTYTTSLDLKNQLRVVEPKVIWNQSFVSDCMMTAAAASDKITWKNVTGTGGAYREYIVRPSCSSNFDCIEEIKSVKKELNLPN